MAEVLTMQELSERLDAATQRIRALERWRDKADEWFECSSKYIGGSTEREQTMLENHAQMNATLESVSETLRRLEQQGKEHNVGSESPDASDDADGAVKGV